jgi:hypothetical protein
MKEGKDPKRLNLVIPTPVYARIEEVQRLTNAASVSEVLRAALATYEVLVRAVKTENAEVTITPARGVPRQLVLPI